MIIKKRIALEDFQCWYGGEELHKFIYNLGLMNDLENRLMEEYPEGIDEIHLNDLFRFDGDYLAKLLGYNSEEELIKASEEDMEKKGEEE